MTETITSNGATIRVEATVEKVTGSATATASPSSSGTTMPKTDGHGTQRSNDHGLRIAALRDLTHDTKSLVTDVRGFPVQTSV